MEMVITMMMQQALAADELFFKTGVERDDYEASMIYLIKTDPNVKLVYEDYIKEMDAMSAMVK